MTDKPSTMVGTEQRRAIRKLLHSDALFISQQVTVKSALTLDLSRGGLSLTLPEPLPDGQRCAISFDVPTGRNRQRTLVRGSIVSCIQNSINDYRIGVQFAYADPTSRQLIHAALEHHLQAAV